MSDGYVPRSQRYNHLLDSAYDDIRKTCREDLVEEENLEEIWEKSNQWEEREKLEKGREELEEEEDNLEKSKEELEEQEEHREQSERWVSKGQLVGRTKYNSISEVPDHMDLDLEVGGGRSVENR